MIFFLCLVTLAFSANAAELSVSQSKAKEIETKINSTIQDIEHHFDEKNKKATDLLKQIEQRVPLLGPLELRNVPDDDKPSIEQTDEVAKKCYQFVMNFENTEKNRFQNCVIASQKEAQNGVSKMLSSKLELIESLENSRKAVRECIAKNNSETVDACIADVEYATSYFDFVHDTKFASNIELIKAAFYYFVPGVGRCVVEDLGSSSLNDWVKACI